MSNIPWKVGDLVWLERKQPRPNSNRVLSHRRFGDAPYYITKIVERQESPKPDDCLYASLAHSKIAPAYQLADSRSGKLLKYLVSSRRLKRCYNKEQLNKLCPPLPTPRAGNGVQAQGTSEQTPAVSPQGTTQPTSADNSNAQPATSNSTLQTGWEQAKSIIRKRAAQGRVQYLVKFLNNESWWCEEDAVSEEMKRRFFLKRANERNRRQKTARLRFKNS